jgi:hypothetical protein
MWNVLLTLLGLAVATFAHKDVGLFAYDSFNGYVRIEPQSGKQLALGWNNEPNDYWSVQPAQSGIFAVDKDSMDLWFTSAPRDTIVQLPIKHTSDPPKSIPLPSGKTACQLAKVHQSIVVLMTDGTLYQVNKTSNALDELGTYPINPSYECGEMLVFDPDHKVLFSVWDDYSTTTSKLYGYHVNSKFFFQLPDKDVPFLFGLSYVPTGNGTLVAISPNDYGAVSWSPLTESWDDRKLVQYFGEGYDFYECGIATLYNGDVFYILNDWGGTFYLYGFNINSNVTFPTPVVCGADIECPMFLFSL